MRRIIRAKAYDTENAELVGCVNHSYFGDPAGYSERLYKSPEGFFFLHTAGGQESPYKSEQIRAISASNAGKWMDAHAVVSTT